MLLSLFFVVLHHSIATRVRIGCGGRRDERHMSVAPQTTRIEYSFSEGRRRRKVSIFNSKAKRIKKEKEM